MTWRPSSQPIDDALWLNAPSIRTPFMVHAWARWNGSDRIMDTLFTDSPPPWPVSSLDVDDEQFWPALHRLGVVNVPSLLLFGNAKHVHTVQNLSPERLLERAVALLAEYDRVSRTATQQEASSYLIVTARDLISPL